VLPAIFTGRELAERWQERFINAGKPVGLERWENLGGVRTMLVACLNAGFEYALIDPPPGSTEFRRRWHLETVVDLLNA